MLDIGPLHEDTCGASLQSSAVHSLSPGWGFSNGVLVKSLTASFSGKKKKKERKTKSDLSHIQISVVYILPPRLFSSYCRMGERCTRWILRSRCESSPELPWASPWPSGALEPLAAPPPPLLLRPALPSWLVEARCLHRISQSVLSWGTAGDDLRAGPWSWLQLEMWEVDRSRNYTFKKKVTDPLGESKNDLTRAAYICRTVCTQLRGIPRPLKAIKGHSWGTRGLSGGGVSDESLTWSQGGWLGCPDSILVFKAHSPPSLDQSLHGQPLGAVLS